MNSWSDQDFYTKGLCCFFFKTKLYSTEEVPQEGIWLTSEVKLVHWMKRSTLLLPVFVWADASLNNVTHYLRGILEIDHWLVPALKSQEGRLTCFASWNNLSSPPDCVSSLIYVKTGNYTEGCEFMLHTVTEKAAAGLPHTTHTQTHTKLSDEGAACSKSKGAEVNSLTAEHAISPGWCTCVSEFAAINHRLCIKFP